MNDKDLKVIQRIESEIEKINKNENNIYFFTVDSKGYASGEIEYVYKLALLLKNNGYKVTMLHQEDDFVGVKDWLGEEYANLPHENINKGNINVGVSDILIIPEVFTSVMNQTKDLPCKRIILLYNLTNVTEFTPLAIEWGNYSISDCIVSTAQLSSVIKSWFPYIKTNIVNSYIDETVFHNSLKPKDMIINVISKNQSDINKIIKPFYWKFPIYKWVSFKDLRGMEQTDFSNALCNGAITIWIDEDTNFGSSALEALQCGSIVIAKIPKMIPEWALNEKGELNNSCIWFDNYEDVHKIIANIVRGWTTDNIPNELYDEPKKIVSKYNKNNTINELTDFFKQLFENRKNELNNLIDKIKNNTSNEEKNE